MTSDTALGAKYGAVVYPDPPARPDVLSAATFLYFEDPVLVTTPRLLLVPGSLEVVQRVAERMPEWGPSFLAFFQFHREQVESFGRTTEMLSPLSSAMFRVHLTYSGTSTAFEEAWNWGRQSGLKASELAEIADLPQASGEVMYHLLMETFLETGQDVEKTIAYAADLFRRFKPEELMARGLLVRMRNLNQLGKSSNRILLTNERLLPFLGRMPASTEDKTNPSDDEWRDVLAWNLFRALLSPRLDPLDAAKTTVVASLRENRRDEIDRLRERCRKIASELITEREVAKLETVVCSYIEKNVATEIQALLDIKRSTAQALIRDVITDPKAWAALFGGGFALHHDWLTGGAVLGGLLAFAGPKLTKTMLTRRDAVKQSDFALIYSLHNSTHIRVK